MRYFIINYMGGFALMSDIAGIKYVVEKETSVCIRETCSMEQAYVWGACEYVRRERAVYPGKQAIPPKYEAMQDSPIFHEAGYQPNSVSVRFFAGIHPEKVAILTSPLSVVEYVAAIPLGEVHECSNILEAQNHIRHRFENKLMAMGAYFEEPIPTYYSFPVDQIISVDYLPWLMARRNLVPEPLWNEFLNPSTSARLLENPENSVLQLDIGKLVDGYNDGDNNTPS